MIRKESHKMLVLGGKPIASCDIVQYVKSLGVTAIVTDNLSPEQSLAKNYADEVWEISTGDIEALAAKIRETGTNSIFTGVHEFNISKAAELCDRLNLPFYATPTQIVDTSVKSIYKDMFRRHDVPVVPEYYIDENFSQEHLDKIEYPVILKPVDGSGGYGITVCYNQEELIENYSKAMEHSSLKKVLLERYIDSQEATIFYVLQDGKIYLSAISDRYTANGGENIIPLPVAYIFPSIHIDTYIKNLNDKVISAFESIGLKNGMIFIQSFVNEKGEFTFYDIGFRLTGTQEYHILEKICGYNPLKMMVDYSLTGRMGKENISGLVDPYLHNKYACNITYLCKPCKIGRISGADKVKSLPGIIEVVLNHQEGDEIPKTALGTLNQVILRVFAITDSKDQLVKLIEDINHIVKVYSDQEESVLLPSIDINNLIIKDE